ncbi:MAG: hypothetical protein JETCAE03_31750 [Ignavibacteriaceae bacterium]|jgi:hypothetical protein|nr:MAG: hypothetical protein JETCAE03_31750 [Ignavibacteriaceae bacterium]
MGTYEFKNENGETVKIDELQLLCLQILYLADLCNYQGGALRSDDITIIANYIVQNNIDIVDLIDKSKNDVEVGINFFNLVLQTN